MGMGIPWHHGSAGLHSAVWHQLNRSWCATCCQPQMQHPALRPQQWGGQLALLRLILGESACF